MHAHAAQEGGREEGDGKGDCLSPDRRSCHSSLWLRCSKFFFRCLCGVCPLSLGLVLCAFAAVVKLEFFVGFMQPMPPLGVSAAAGSRAALFESLAEEHAQALEKKGLGRITGVKINIESTEEETAYARKRK